MWRNLFGRDLGPVVCQITDDDHDDVRALIRLNLEHPEKGASFGSSEASVDESGVPSCRHDISLPPLTSFFHSGLKILNAKNKHKYRAESLL
jgi:hypothetical protein